MLVYTNLIPLSVDFQLIIYFVVAKLPFTSETVGGTNLPSTVILATYTYGDSTWGDLLTAYNGVPRTYDEIGNLLTDGTWTYTWQNGRELASMTDGTTTWNYTYDANGMRTSRSNGTKTYNYVYNGSQLTQMTVGNDTLYFTYGVLGPTTVTWNGTTYYYSLNGQGDVTGIFDENGTLVVAYNWDNAWGYNPIPEGSMASTLGALNPLRYRSYVYDTETGYYYLQSRYYDPEIGRFINADVFVSTGQSFVGHNMFAYCGNNPVNHIEIGGYFWDTILDIASLCYSVIDVASNPNDFEAWLGLVGDTVDLIPFVSGVGEITKIATKTDDVVDAVRTIEKVDDTADAVRMGWRVGDDISNLTKAGKIPSWSTVRQRFWKNEAFFHPELYPNDLERLKRGLAPIGEDGFSIELHHPFGRNGSNFFVVESLTQTEHRWIHYGG